MKLAGSQALLPAGFVGESNRLGGCFVPEQRITSSQVVKAVLPVRLAPRSGDHLRLDEARWLRLHTYAATAEAWSGVSCAPPIGGIALR